MSVYREKIIKSSRKVRRCVGCDNFPTIKIGDPYYDCFSTEPDPGGFALCVPCHDHLDKCDECQDVAREGIRGVRECREAE